MTVRPHLLLALAACGAPAFVPVTFTAPDILSADDIFVTATKKLNPNCTANCELGVAIEDGGCKSITFQGGYACEPGGGLFAPFYEGTSDGGTFRSAVRMIAPGSELKVFDTGRAGEPRCMTTLTVPPSALEVTVARGFSTCAVTQSP